MSESRTIQPESDDLETGARRMRPWQLLLVGMGAALLGLLPWLLTGMRLPLQNLWATDTLPDDMPLVLLPFSQYSLSTIASLLVVGAAAGGLAGRILRARTPARGFALLFFGVLLVDVVAVAQSAATVGPGLREDTWSAVYLAGVLTVAVLAVGIGASVLWLIGRAPQAGAVVGIAIAAVLLPGWLHLLMAPRGPAFAGEPEWLWTAVRWVPSVLIGLAIAWAGVRTAGRIIAAIAALALLWLAPALITAASAALGSRVLARVPGEMLDYGAGVFRLAATDPDLVVKPIVVAVVVAAVGLVVRALLARRTAARAGTGGEASGA
jgi:hypothetical protein